MNSNHSRCITITLGAAAGGLLAAAFLPMAVAHAGEFVYTPYSYIGSPQWGIQGLFGGSSGTAFWSTADFTSQPPSNFPDTLAGTMTQTQIGLFTNDVFTVFTHTSDPGYLSLGSTIDLANYGFGFGNELVNAAANSDFAPGIYDTAITPFGDFLLF